MRHNANEKENKYVCLKRNGKRIDEHRLIAIQHWGEEAVKGMDVHHINGLKYDNRIENLELVKRGEHTRQHNIGKKLANSTKEKIGIHSRNYWKDRTSEDAKRVVQETLEGVPIVQFESASSTSSYGYDDTAVSKCCIGRLKTYHNFRWRFVLENENLKVPLLKRIPKKSYKRTSLKFHGGLSERSIESALKADGGDEPSKGPNPLPSSMESCRN